MDLQKSECLSFGDSLFLHLERPGMPLHVAALCIFDGEISEHECRKHLQAKLPLVPRYWQRVVTPPFGLGVMTWEYDPNFDIRNHLHEVKLKQGTLGELENITAEILSKTLDRSRPLWDFSLLTGLKGKRSAILARVHHCLADGISGVELLTLLLDTDPKTRVRAVPPPHVKPSTPRDQASLLLEGIGVTWFSTFDRILTAESQLLKLAQEFTAGTANSAAKQPSDGNGNVATPWQGGISDGLTSILTEFGSPPERLPFNVVCRGPQKFFWTELPFEDIRAIKKTCGVTVNDAVLTLVTSTVRHYARSHHISTAGRVLRIVVPVSIRTRSQANGLGNQITFAPVTIPLGERNPRSLLDAVHARMELIKKMRVAELVGLAGTVLGAIPAPFQALAGPIVSQLPLNVCNLICTNVPGPRTPLYLLGRRMLTFYPYVPIGGEMGMNCAVLTYDGKAFVGFTGDVNAIPDLKLLPDLLRRSFDELKEATGVRSKRKSGRTSRSRVATRIPPQPLVPAAPEVPLQTRAAKAIA